MIQNLLYIIYYTEFIIQNLLYRIYYTEFIINSSKINNPNINLIIPKRTNQKIRNTEQEKIKIKKRSLIKIFSVQIKNIMTIV